MSTLIHITEDRVQQLLDWDSVFAAVEHSLVATSQGRAFQNPRTFTNVLGTNNLLLCMPGYLKNNTGGTLACKLVTAFPGNEIRNPFLPTILANIFLFDDETGQLKSIVEGTEITKWRTAAASAVATKYLHFRDSSREANILAIFGAGTQGRIHAIAFHHFFKFKEVRIWNHHFEKAKKLTEELLGLGIPAKAFGAGQDCANDADVIVTATFATNPIVRFEWVKKNVHINAVGAGTNHHSELDTSLYHNAFIYTDHLAGAKVELKGLKQLDVFIQGEVGEFITGDKQTPDASRITVFHSLGMAAEDAAVAQLIYDRHTENNDAN